MTAYRCTRCGVIYADYDGVKPSDNLMEANGLTFTRMRFSETPKQTGIMNLCPDCMQGLADWWGGKENDND